MSANPKPEETQNRPVIFVVIGQLDVGGAETHLARVLPELDPEDYEIVMFVFSGGGTLEEKFRRCGIGILCPPHRKNRFIRLIQCALSLQAAIVKHKPSVMHFFLPEAYILGSIVSLSRPGVVRVMSRRSLSRYQQRRPLLAKLELIMHRVLFGALANSRAVSKELSKEGIPDKKIGLIYNGVLPHVSSSRAAQIKLKNELQIADTSIVFVCVANLIPYKGHGDILRALAMLDPALNWHMVFAGEDRGILSELKSEEKRLGIRDRISWVGKVEVVNEYLDIADVALLASHEEGFSNFILEAMAASLPIVATAVGGNSEAVIHEHTGLLIPVRDPDALSGALRDLSLDKNRRLAMGAAGHQRALRQFSHDLCVENYQRLYLNLVSKNRVPLNGIFPVDR